MTREELIPLTVSSYIFRALSRRRKSAERPVPSSGHAGNRTVCKSSAFKVHAIASCQHHSILRGFGWASFLAGSASAFAL